MPGKYRQIIDNLPDAFAYIQVLFDCEGNPEGCIFLNVNQAFEALTGLLKENMIGKRAAEVCPRIYNASFDWIGTHGRVATTGETIRFEQYFEHPKQFYEVTAYMDTPGYVVTVFRDISHHKQTQDQLTKERDELTGLLDTILDITPDLIFFKDTQGYYLGCNAKFAQHVGYREEEIIGKTDDDLSSKEKADDCRKKDQYIIDLGTPYQKEEWVTYPDGRTILLDTITTPYRDKDGKVIGILGISRDITKRKQAEDALLESNKKLKASQESYRILVDNTPDHIYSLDQNFRYTAMNKSGCQSLGLEAHDVIGKNPFELGLPKDVAEKLEELFQSVCNTANNIKTEITSPMPDGSVKTYDLTLIPILDDQEKVIGIRGTSRDITERMILEQEIIKADRFESIGLLAGGIAHDFNNFLAVLLSNITLAKLYKNDAENVREKLENMEKATLRTKDLSNQLFAFSKEGAPVKERICIRQLIIDNINFSLSGSKVRPVFSIAEDLYMVEADKGQLCQVLSNLAINAVQAMPDGGVLDVRAENLEIFEQNNLFSQNEPYIKITVKDEGIGIPENSLPNIFDPFFSTKDEGWGLGLATAYSIIKKHGGHLILESELGVGTSAYIYLPAIAQAEASCAVSVDPFKGTGRILIMEDDEDLLTLTGEALSALGYDVTLTKNGKEALEQYIKQLENCTPFNLVILDLTIPGGIGGKEILKELKKKDRNVKAIVASGYSNDPVVSRYSDYGFKGAITKPYTVEELSRVVYDAMK